MKMIPRLIGNFKYDNLFKDSLLLMKFNSNSNLALFSKCLSLLSNYFLWEIIPVRAIINFELN